jgi:hypothetical protein
MPGAGAECQRHKFAARTSQSERECALRACQRNGPRWIHEQTSQDTFTALIRRSGANYTLLVLNCAQCSHGEALERHVQQSIPRNAKWLSICIITLCIPDSCLAARDALEYGAERPTLRSQQRLPLRTELKPHHLGPYLVLRRP